MARGSTLFKQGVNSADLARQFSRGAGSDLSVLRNSPTSGLSRLNEVDILSMVLSQPKKFTSLLNKIDNKTLSNIVDSMKPGARDKFLKNADPSVTKRLNLDSVAAKNVDVRFPDGSTKSVKYGSPGFWNAVSNGATILGGLTLLAWIDKKFEKAEEEYKNCMAGCLPHNWDEYDSGTLDKSNLKYSTVETLKEHGLEPIGNQPYCKKTIKDCGKFCDEKCEKETEVDLPGSSAATGILDKFRRALESFLPDIPGVDPTIISFASSASSMLMFMLIIMQFAV
jgi:hypothetical protein